MQYNHEWINFYDLFHFLHLQDVSGDFNRLLPAQILIQHLKSSRRDTSDIDYKFWMNGVFHWFIIIHSDSADRSIRRAWDKNPAKDIIEQFFTEIDVT
jgi:hypothetical protein